MITFNVVTFMKIMAMLIGFIMIADFGEVMDVTCDAICKVLKVVGLVKEDEEES